MKEKVKENIKSSEKLAKFLEKNELHKKDFAEKTKIMQNRKRRKFL